ncbi:MAG: IS5 family transposase [Candidatus Caenarcaniphilales bacterium]|nr:IS5 family transposase [Candidatus Caenarcaniphilales bacterium]
MRYEQVCNKKAEDFRRLTGIKKETFTEMLLILKEAEILKMKKRGRPHKLSLEDRLLMALEYLREYRTYFHVATSYGISESNCYQSIRWIENTLIKCGKFTFPGRKELLKSDIEYEVILIDATESPIERPKKKQKRYYSGKKKRHTLKTQVVVDPKTQKVICTSFSEGKKHDFKLFEKSQIKIKVETNVKVDSGYQGLQKIHNNTDLPKKKTKKNPLTPEDKVSKSKLASDRVLNENVIGKLKRFKIISDRYRNRRKRFGLRFNLITGIYNFELNR